MGQRHGEGKGRVQSHAALVCHWGYLSGAFGSWGYAGLSWGLCLFAQNILGLHNIPRQFFLQVYHTFQRIGETRSADISVLFLDRSFHQQPGMAGVEVGGTQGWERHREYKVQLPVASSVRSHRAQADSAQCPVPA